ncbi:sulfatase family protein [Cohnella caldifontis]|uniref:sulfatase family protein n=1 Tax=Cohnella caldifontis TaxID=3027471 RepID=UPI0023EBE77A|nr:sulfatase [Cohnella sp. YIM B05605]
MSKKPNLILFGIDSLRRDHMSLYGYHRLTTPHIDRFAQYGAVFENHFSPHIPTTPGYASMLTGLDSFGTDVVALRHQGGLGGNAVTLAEILKSEGYVTACVGFTGNVAARGFDHYLDYEGWRKDDTGRCPKADNLNQVALPLLERLAAGDQPFFLFLRHMDPHTPYLPPAPFDRLFYGGNEKDPDHRSLDEVFRFKPFAEFFKGWFPEGVTDSAYIDAQYDGAVAYLDASVQALFNRSDDLGISGNTLFVITSDHGETLNEHECYYDHHGLYDSNLTTPLIFRFQGRVPEGQRYSAYSYTKDITPTILDLLNVHTDIAFDGRSLAPLFAGGQVTSDDEFYITECTWMRKHGWRTPEWKLIVALEPDFHGKPRVELYDLVRDPEELVNVADARADIVTELERRLNEFVRLREAAVGRTNPIYTNTDWHGLGTGPFTSSEAAYEALGIRYKR